MPESKIIIGTASRQYAATNINSMRTHAINSKTLRALCSDKLNIIDYAPETKATPENVTCRRCLRKLEEIYGRQPNL